MARDFETIISYDNRTYRLAGFREPRDGEIWLHPDGHPNRSPKDTTPVADRPKRFILREIHPAEAILAGTPAAHPTKEGGEGR